MSNNKVIELSSAKYVRLAQHNGEELQLYARPIQPTDFPKCQVYSVVASRGKVKGSVEYFITYNDYIANRPTRATRTDAILAMQAQGLTSEEIVAQLLAKAQK